jgi:hypothetical protein
MDPLIETTTQSLPHMNWPTPDYLDHFSSGIFKRALHYISAGDLDNTKKFLEILNDGDIELHEKELILLRNKAFLVEKAANDKWLTERHYPGLGIYGSVDKFVTDRYMVMVGAAIRSNNTKLFGTFIYNKKFIDLLDEFNDLFTNNVITGIKNNDPSLLDWYTYINKQDDDAIIIAAIENKCRAPIWKKLREVGFELPANPLKLLNIDERLFGMIANQYKDWIINNHGLLSDEQLRLLINNCVWWEELKIDHGWWLKQSINEFTSAEYVGKIYMIEYAEYRVEKIAFDVLLEDKTYMLEDLKKFILTNDSDYDNIEACYTLIDASKDVDLQILEWVSAEPNATAKFVFGIMRTVFEDGEYEHLFKNAESLLQFKDINTNKVIQRCKTCIWFLDDKFFDTYKSLGISIDMVYIDTMILVNSISFIKKFSKIADPTVWTTCRHRFLLASVDQPDIADLIDKLSAAVDFESVYELPTAVNRANRIVGHIQELSYGSERPFELLFEEPAAPVIISSEFINHSQSIRQTDALPQPITHHVQESSGRVRFRFGAPVIAADTPFHVSVLCLELRNQCFSSAIEYIFFYII